jgi:ABC-type hemin transport system substrate-binding protein
VIADPAAYASRYDVLATTFFHLQEVNAAIESGGIEVVGMNHAPSHETVLEIARLEPSITIAVVAQNERTLKLVQTIVEMYSRGRIISAITTDREGFQRALREADVTVVHALAHEEVLRIKPRTVTVTVKFQIEQQSIEFLRDAVVRRRDVFSATV